MMEQPTAESIPQAKALDVELDAYWEAKNRGQVNSAREWAKQHSGEATGLEPYLAILDLFYDARRSFDEPLPESMPELPGFEVQEIIGRGGMGVVYKATQLEPPRLVALKMIATNGLARPEVLARFRTEARAVARLQHPNIVPIYAVGDHAGQPYLVLEYVDGGSLQQALGGEPVSAQEAAAVLQGLAAAVAVAHNAGIIHRDLKPANILLSPQAGVLPSAIAEPTGVSIPRQRIQGIPKIADFGLAKLQAAEDAPGVTLSGAILGTPSYMAPEQALGKARGIGPAADIYALGAILYELLTGTAPFKGDSAHETIQLVVEKEPVAPRVLRRNVPQDLETICLKCLQKQPGHRYLSAQALWDDLRRFRIGDAILARPVSRLERTWRWCRRQPARAALYAVIALLVSAGVLLGYQRNQTSWQMARAEAIRSATLQNIQDLKQTFKDSDRLLGTDALGLRNHLLSWMITAFDGLIADRPGDVALQTARGELLAQRAWARWQLGEISAAERDLAESEEIASNLIGTEPGEPRYQMFLGTTLDHLAGLQSQRKEPCLATWLRASDALKQAVIVAPDVEAYRWQLARVLLSMATERIASGESRDAQQGCNEALRLVAMPPKGQPWPLPAREIYCAAKNQLGLILLSEDNGKRCPLVVPVPTTPGAKSPPRTQQALIAFREAVEVSEGFVNSQANRIKYLDVYASCRYNLAALLYWDGDGKQALPLFETAIQSYEKAYAMQPNYPHLVDYLKEGCVIMAVLHEKLGHWRESAALFGRAVHLEPQEPRRSQIHSRRIFALAIGGEHQTAMTEIRTLARPAVEDQEARYMSIVAPIYAAEAVARDLNLKPDAIQALQMQYLDWEFQRVRQLQDTGFFSEAVVAGHLRDNPTFRRPIVAMHPDLSRLFAQVGVKGQ